MVTEVLAVVAGVVGLATLVFTGITYFLNVGGAIVEQATRVIVVLYDGEAQVHNLSDSPIANLQIFYDARPVTLNGPDFLCAVTGQTAAPLAPTSTSKDSLAANYVGVRGLRWQRWADGRLEISSVWWRSFLVRLITWPWLTGDLSH